MATQTEIPPVMDKKPWALKALPPFPGVALQLLSLLDNPDVPLAKIVELLRVDPALSAEVLRVANSALYGFVQRIDTVKHAVVVLGSENVKRLALTVALNKFSTTFLRYKDLRTCWDHVMASAMIAEELAVQLGVSKDRAYTAGLLHDVGRLAMLVCYPQEYGNLLFVARAERFDQLVCERELFDLDHCAAGRWLAEHWNLPADFALAIAEHHGAGPAEGELTPLVRAACRLADCLGFSVLEMPPAETVADVLASLPLLDRSQSATDLEASAERIRQALSTMSSPA